MKQALHQIHVNTKGKGLYDVTKPIKDWTLKHKMVQGLLTIFIQHTSASLLIQENADPDVVQDLKDFFAHLVPEDNRLYRHNAEGPDDMPAHIRSALTQSQLSIPVQKGHMMLGMWQGIYLFEHRDEEQKRKLILHCIGDVEC